MVKTDVGSTGFQNIVFRSTDIPHYSLLHLVILNPAPEMLHGLVVFWGFAFMLTAAAAAAAVHLLMTKCNWSALAAY